MTYTLEQARDLFEGSARHVTELVESITQADWDAPTPCSKWSVRDLSEHLISEMLWAPALLAGATLAEVGDQFDGENLGPEPVHSWHTAMTAGLAAVQAPDLAERTVHLSYGDAPATHYVFQLASDLLIHSWDLARGIDADDQLDPDAVALLLSEMEDHDLSASGLFGPPVHVPDDADAQTRLLAVYGRAQHPDDQDQGL